MIAVKSDPKHPRGGYAELSMPEGDIAGETTQVAIFDNYSERYLGDAGWQPSKVMFGPYDITREAGTAKFVIGPEIVNQIEEYANIKLIVGTAEQDVSWPDDVVPAPGAAKIGGIMGASLKEAAPKGALTAKMPEAKPAPEPVAPVVATDTAPIPEPVTETVAEPVKKSKGGLIAGILLLVLAAAGIAYWLSMEEEIPEEPVVAPEPVAQADPCGMAELSGLADFAAQASALRSCGSKTTADIALGLVERAATSGDAGALLLFGTVYDGQANAAVIEDQIGLTFGDEPATAAEYYARAVAAGSVEAADNLAALCTRMAGMSDTLVQGAVSDYCAK